MATRDIAGVDLGSNSFHLVLGRVTTEGHVQVLDRHKETVRLASGLQPDGTLSADALERADACLARFSERIRGIDREALRCVGTSTLRRAKNAHVLLEAGARRLGREIEVISGLEEARLIYAGVLSDVSWPGRRLVLDIGGGSTEIIVGDQNGPEALQSFPFGCVVLTQECFADGRVDADRMLRATRTVQRRMRPWSRVPLAKHAFSLGSSGTILTAARLMSSDGHTLEAFSRASLQRLIERLVDAGHANAFKAPALSEQRRPVLAGGLAVLAGVMDALAIDEMSPVESALREGLLAELVGESPDGARRERTMRSFERRFDVDREQADRVAQTALGLLADAGPEWVGRDRFDAQGALVYAARLHESGLSLALEGYHKHGAYLIANSDMPGFSVRRQREIAALVLAHRGRFDDERLARFRLQGATSRRLMLLLRLAVRLHRSRTNDPHPAVRLAADGDRVVLRFPNGWLDAHPLTQLDLEAEVTRCASVGITLGLDGSPT